MPSPALLRELGCLVRGQDAQAVRESLRHSAVALDGLGLNGHRHDLAELSDPELLATVGEALRRHRLDAEAARRGAAVQKAERAASELSTTARWKGNVVELNPRLVLGDLLAAPTKFVAFHINDTAVPVLRSKLLQLRRIAGRLPALAVTLNSEALEFRWRQGTGGLNFRPQHVSRDDRDEVMHVVLARPVPTPEPVPVRRDGAWLNEVLADLGFII